jgi:hypothetical protein
MPIVLTVAVLYLVVIVACGRAVPSISLAPPNALARCINVLRDRIELVEETLIVSGGSIDSATAQVVKSKDFDSYYFIAAAIHGPGMEENGQLGVWAIGSLEPFKGHLFPVGTKANEYTQIGDGATTDVRFSTSHEGYEEAVACVKSKQLG